MFEDIKSMHSLNVVFVFFFLVLNNTNNNSYIMRITP